MLSMQMDLSLTKFLFKIYDHVFKWHLWIILKLFECTLLAKHEVIAFQPFDLKLQIEIKWIISAFSFAYQHVLNSPLSIFRDQKIYPSS